MPDGPPLCREDDAYVRHSLRWVVLLSNGETVYQDDDRPGVDPPSAWRRLRSYCRDGRLHVARMWLQFRSHLVEMPAGAPGYYFSKTAFGVWGEPESYSGCLVGTLTPDGRLRVVHWKTPELQPLDEEVRDIDLADDRLITRTS